MSASTESYQDTLPARKPLSYRRACRTLRAYAKDRLAHPWLDRYWPQCVMAESMSRDELLELQQERFKGLLQHAIEHVPFYREWASREGVRAGNEVPLEQLPIVSKSDYLERSDGFLSDAFDRTKLRAHQTSGSSGEPLTVRNDAATRDYSYCCLWRALLRHGVRPGDRLVHVWGSGKPRFASSIKTAIFIAAMRGRDWMASKLPVSARDLTDTTLENVIRDIERFRPHYIHGYVSALEAIALFLVNRDRTLKAPGLKLVVNDSEPFGERQRQLMERAFNCRVVEHYGCLEVGNIAQEDPAGRLRVNEDYLILERSPRGEAIVTHLMARAMPFIRYRVGDLIEFDKDIGPGLPYRSIASIEGRTTDLLPVAGGGYVHGLAIATAVYKGRPQIQRYQVRQRQVDHFEISLVCDAPLSADLKSEITASVRRLTGACTSVDVRSVSEIPREPSGKFRLVVSDVKRQPDHGMTASSGTKPPTSAS